jgi:isochorismate hydrolase
MSDNQLITREESLLVIIDMQERLVPAMAEAERLTANMKRLLGLAAVMDLPVIVTEQEKLGPTVREVSEKVTSPEPISKSTFNCFLSEAFAARVGETARNTLIIAGIEAHICVAQTALSGHPRFRIHVVSDAVGSRSPDNVSVALDRMRAAGIIVTSTEMVIYELLRKAGTAEFKAMLPLIK